MVTVIRIVNPKFCFFVTSSNAMKVTMYRKICDDFKNWGYGIIRRTEEEWRRTGYYFAGPSYSRQVGKALSRAGHARKIMESTSLFKYRAHKSS